MKKLEGYKTLTTAAAIVLTCVAEGIASGDFSKANWIGIGTAALFAVLRFLTTGAVGTKKALDETPKEEDTE